MIEVNEEYLKIKYELARKGVLMSDIARTFSCSQEMVRLSLSGRRTSKLAIKIVEYVDELINPKPLDTGI